MKLFATHFNKNGAMLKGAYRYHYPKNSLAVLPADITRQMITEGRGRIYPLSDLFDAARADKTRVAFTHLPQGIGDAVVFSAITEYLSTATITVHMNPYFWPLFKYFSHRKLFLKHFHEPIVNDFTFGSLMTKYRNLHRIPLEFAANEAGADNWIRAYFNRLGVEPTNDMCRPVLIPQKKTGSGILICHRASCQIRSSGIEDFYIPIRRTYPDARVYVHERNLTENDKNVLVAINADITIIPHSNDFDRFLKDLLAFDLIVSTDTAAIHFREGVGLPAVGVYGAFSTASRTQYYVHTHSFDVKTACPYFPCFKHETVKGELCRWAAERKEAGTWTNETIAPCQSGELFREQLTQELIDNQKQPKT
ncbi:MAG TPA: hypothetical protein P5531_03815 [Bacteroidales bacterium]|nr:hypothetical protein [Bacteroidales bacterium]